MNFVKNITPETWIKWAIGFVLFMVSSTYYVVNVQKDNYFRIQKLEEDISFISSQTNAMKEKQNDFNVVMAKIEQNLSNINTDLMLIKKKLDEIQK